METNKPAYEKRLGSVRLAIWENSSNGKPWFNVAITRRYKDGDDWKDATTFNGLGDLALVSEAVNMAKTWVAEREQANG